MYDATLISALGILLTTCVAIYTIRRTAKENKITNIHTELVSCLVETSFLLDRIIYLLKDIAHRVVYNKKIENKITETAYSRFWREIDGLSKKFKYQQVKQRLICPKSLYQLIEDIIKDINEASEIARYMTPNDEYIYPDTSDLKIVVDRTIEKYKSFLHESRKYLGTDKLEPISLVSELPIKSKEKSEYFLSPNKAVELP